MIDTTTDHIREEAKKKKSIISGTIILGVVFTFVIGIYIGFFRGRHYQRKMSYQHAAKLGFAEYKTGEGGEAVFTWKIHLVKLEYMIGRDGLPNNQETFEIEE